MKCPLCGVEMKTYQEKAGNINEIGSYCKACEIGFYSYKNQDSIDYIISNLIPSYISKQEQIDWLESKLKQQAE